RPDCRCIILDVRREGLSGPQLVDALVRVEGSPAALPPVIFLTGHAHVPLAVESLKGGAFGFMAKPFNDNQIVDRALQAMELHQSRSAEAMSRGDLIAQFASLSEREAEVMSLILDGQLNKQIAEQLGIAIRTVE